MNSSIWVCLGLLNICYFPGNLKKTILTQKGTLGFDWNEQILKAKINCNGLYELLGTYEGSLGICVYNFEAVLQVVLLSPKNRKKSGNNWIDAPDIVSKRLASNNLLKILYKDCLESVLQKRWKLCKCAPSEEVRVILFFIIFSLETMLNVSLEILWLTLSLCYPEASQSVGGIAAKKNCTCWLAAFHLMLTFFFFALIFLWVYLKIFTYIFTYIYINIRMNVHTCSVLCEYMHIVYRC